MIEAKLGEAGVASENSAALLERAIARFGEERLVLTLCYASDLLLFWLMLNAATLTRLHTLHMVDFSLLQRDRVICMMIFSLCMALVGAYRSTRITDRFDAIYFSGLGLLATGVVEFLLVALLPREWIVISRRELALGVIFSVPVLAVWRFCAVDLVTRFDSLHRFFYVFGTEEEGARIAQEFNECTETTVEAHYIAPDQMARRFDEGGAPVRRERDAIICLRGEDRDELLTLLEYCEPRFRRTFVYPSLHDVFLFQHHSLLAVGGVPLIQVANQHPNGAYLRLKRLMDVSAALGMLVLSSPLCLAATITIKCTSKGAIFYTQERVGKGGKLFHIYKFRTMVNDAEAKTGPMWAIKNDARVTPVGRFLRKHRIDEIPQILNVLRGDMSLVGPRPERPHFHEAFCAALPLFKHRLVVRPGLTSLSHVLGSYSSDPADRLRYDLAYIGNLSFVNDCKILLSTIRVVLGAKGAQ